MAEDYGYYSATGAFIEAPKKEALRIQFPYALRFAIVWTIFFIILGVGIQYYVSMGPGLTPRPFMDVFTSFFTTEYATWFRSFGSFVNITEYDSAMSIFTSIMGHWYYFFYTGGLLSLIWGLISWIINMEIVFHKRNKEPKPIPYIPPAPVAMPIIVEKPVYVDKPVYIKEEVKPQVIPSKPFVQADIEDWLAEGFFLLSEGRVYEAQSIYEQIKRYYDPEQDIGQKTYKRVLDFYYEIMNKKA